MDVARSDSAVAAFVARAAERLAPIRDEFPFASRGLATKAGTIHYVDEGPRSKRAIVCVHGNPTWSFAFRRIVRAFSPRHRVVALDHLGCGLSDKPRDWDYTLRAHAENLHALVVELGLEDVTLVMHDWGGAIGMGFARRASERVSRMLVMNSAAFPSTHMPWRIRACRVPLIGPVLVQQLNAFAGLAPRMALHDASRLSARARRGYLLPYRSAADRIAIRRFVEDIPMSPRHRSWSELASIESALSQFRDRPVSIVWGERDWCFTPAFRAEWERRFPRARVARIEDAGHLVFEEAPDAVASALEDLLTSAP
jgi:haloalkane dehalogenase